MKNLHSVAFSIQRFKFLPFNSQTDTIPKSHKTLKYFPLFENWTQFCNDGLAASKIRAQETLTAKSLPSAILKKPAHSNLGTYRRRVWHLGGALGYTLWVHVTPLCNDAVRHKSYSIGWGEVPEVAVTWKSVVSGERIWYKSSIEYWFSWNKRLDITKETRMPSSFFYCKQLARYFYWKLNFLPCYSLELEQKKPINNGYFSLLHQC